MPVTRLKKFQIGFQMQKNLINKAMTAAIGTQPGLLRSTDEKVLKK